MAKKTKFIKTTPLGTAAYPWLTKADTKFNPDGEFKTDLVFSPEDIEELEAELQAFLDEAFDAYAEEAKPAVKKVLTKADITHPVLDSEGDETGNVFLRFKLKAKVKTKDDEEFEQAPNGFDKYGKPWDTDVAVYGGSQIRVNFEAVPYMSAKDKVVGLTLRLRAFQVHELRTSSGGSAEAYGFDAEEGAFPVEEEEASAPKSKAKAGKTKPDAAYDDDF